VPMPPTTKMLMYVSDVLTTYWWAAIILGAVAVATGVWWKASPSGRRFIDTVIVRAPRLGPIVRSFATARIIRILGVLLEAKIPSLDAIRPARQGTPNACYADLPDNAENAVPRGEGLADILAGSPLVVASVTEALHSGERSGQLGPVLVEVAQFLDEDNEVL